MKEKIKKIISFDFKYDRRREKEELKVVLFIVLILATGVWIMYSGINEKNIIPLLAIAFMLLYDWHRSKLRKQTDE